MLKKELIKISWGPNKQRHFRERGYEFNKGDTIYVRPEDLMKNSHERIHAICDKCGNESGMEYRQYIRACGHFNGKFYCHMCNGTIDSVVEKRRKTCLKKYGVENPMQVKHIREKQNTIMCNNGTVPTSSQQIAIFNMLNDTYDQCYLNYQLSDLSLDCVVNINDCKIDIEYDGIYWHQDYQKDRRRDEFVKSCGYKILRIKSDRHIPALEEIKEKINVLVNTDKQYQEILVQKHNTQ